MKSDAIILEDSWEATDDSELPLSPELVERLRTVAEERMSDEENSRDGVIDEGISEEMGKEDSMTDEETSEESRIDEIISVASVVPASEEGSLLDKKLVLSERLPSLVVPET